jgi:diguanylate cyclase (GGDEF)-like protein
MDPSTLVISTAMAATIMAASMFLLHRASPRERCLLDWSLAGLAFLASNGLALGAIHHRLPFLLVPGLANVFYISGHYLILAGVRRHLGRRPRFDWLALLALSLLAIHTTDYAHGPVNQRLVMLAPAIIVINASVVWLLARRTDPAMRSCYLPLMLVEAVFMLQQAARTIVMAQDQPSQLTFIGAQWVQTTGSLAVLAFLSLATMCCALIVMRRQELALHSAALTDALTGWQNRRALQEAAEPAFQRHRRSGAALHMLMFDIDHFKPINDQYGHAAGDAAIRHVADVAAQALRGYDARFRIGGEEFAVLIAGSSPQHALQVGERLRGQIETAALQLNDRSLTLTVSVGLSACMRDDQHWEDALRRADQALYYAKRHGRNRVRLHEEELNQPPAALVA